MRLRHALLVWPALGIACSSASSNMTHGPVIDASGDTSDNPPDGATGDAAVDAGHKDGGHDAKSGDAPREAPSTDGPKKSDASSCKGTVALAGGTTSVAFAATSVNGAAWVVTPFTTTSTQANPALVPFGGGFMAVFTSATTGALAYSLFGSSSWSAAATADGSACAGAPMALGAVALAAVGTTLHSVYLGTDNKFFHGTFAAGAWDCESDPLTPPAGTQSFGPSAPAAAGVGSSLVAAFDGSDKNLYAQSWTGGTWTATQPVAGATAGTIPPTLIALTGGSSDLLFVFENAGDNKLYWSTRASGTWSSPALTNMNAYTLVPVSVAPMAKGAAALTFLGTDANAYAMTFDPTATTPWSAPTAVLTGGQPVTAPPTVATGICGADAIAAVVQPAGIELVTLASGAWSPPAAPVSGTASLSFVTVATSP